MPDLINGKFVYEPDPEEPVRNTYSFRRRKCPCCGNEYPSELYYGTYNECLGCDECVRVEHILCD